MASFDEQRAQRYDETIRRVIPGYETLHALTASILRSLLPEDASLLLVGAGTGQEVLSLAAASAGWRLTACDPSAAMLAVAEQRAAAAGLAERTEFFPGVVQDLPSPPVAGFAAATCLLVLHFLSDADKLALLQAVGRLLPVGAPLILADMVEDPASPRLARTMPLWADWQRRQGIADDEVLRGLRHVEREVRFLSEAGLNALLAQAGFSPAERFFGGFLFTGSLAVKLRDEI